MKRNPHDRILRKKLKEQHLKMSNFILHVLNHHLKKKTQFQKIKPNSPQILTYWRKKSLSVCKKEKNLEKKWN